MNVKTEAIDQHKVKMTVEVGAEEVQKAFKRAVSNISSRINLKGFRKGKAPRKILEMYIGKDGLAGEAENILINDTWGRALDSEKLTPVTRPDVETSKFSETDGAVYTATFVKEPEVVLGEYKGLSVPHKHPEISDEDVMAQLAEAAKQNARLEVAEGAVLAKGDYAVIDFKGTVDGKEFDGGEGKKYPLEIGSESFIPGFEDQLIGHKAGDDVAVKVSFPDDYFVKDLAGKNAEFATHIIDVKHKIIPELDDDFAKSVSKYDTLEELKNSLRQQMEFRAMQAAEEEYHNALVDLAVSNAKVDVPAEMTEARIDEMIEEMKLNVEADGGHFDEYLERVVGKTEAELRKDYRETAEETVRQGLVLSAIAKAENLKVTNRDLNMEIYSMAHQFGADPKDVIKIIRQENRLNMLIASVTRKKAAAYIYGAAKREEVKEDVAEEKKEEVKPEVKATEETGVKETKKAKSESAEKDAEPKAEKSKTTRAKTTAKAKATATKEEKPKTTRAKKTKTEAK